jgi:hypothetical protein
VKHERFLSPSGESSYLALHHSLPRMSASGGEFSKKISKKRKI